MAKIINLICKKDYLSDDIIFDGKYYWKISWGRKMFKIIPKPILKKGEFHSLKLTDNLFHVESIDTWLTFSYSDVYKTFYDERETKQIIRKLKLKKIKNEISEKR